MGLIGGLRIAKRAVREYRFRTERLSRGRTRILIVGAGSELVMQVCTYHPGEVILFDIDETELHNLGLKLHRRFPQLQGALLTEQFNWAGRADELGQE